MTAPLTCNHQTLDGTPCENLVTYGSAQCAAGHPVSLSNLAQMGQLGEMDNLLASDGVLDMEEVLNGSMPTGAASHPETPGERRTRLAETLIAKTGYDAGLSPFQETHGKRRRLSDGEIIPFEVEVFVTETSVPAYLAYGDLGNGKVWHFQTECTQADCGDMAYVRLRKSYRWSPSASDKFLVSLTDAAVRAPKACCPMHREMVAAEEG